MKNKDYVRSPFNYIGNKFRILDQIIPFFAENQIFVDVFGGSGVVGANTKSKKIIYNELDSLVQQSLQYIYENSFAEVDKNINRIIKKYHLKIVGKAENLPLLNRENFNWLKSDFNNKKIKKEDWIPSFMILIMFGFNSQIRYNSNKEFNIPVGKSGYTEFRRNNLKLFMKKLQEKEAVFYDFHYEELIQKLTNNYSENHDYFFYFDPPYLLSIAPYNANWSIEEEKQFILTLEKLLDSGYKFGINNFLKRNGKVNEVLQEFLTKYQDQLEVIEMSSSYQNSNYQRTRDRSLTEIYIKTKGVI